jgi:hypothetical protein
LYFLCNAELAKDRTDEFYMQNCGKKEPHILYPCTAIKLDNVWVNIADAVRTIKYAFEKMGHPIGPWLENLGDRVSTHNSK